jgi:hypothetical protein
MIALAFIDRPAISNNQLNLGYLGSTIAISSDVQIGFFRTFGDSVGTNEEF